MTDQPTPEAVEAVALTIHDAYRPYRGIGGQAEFGPSPATMRGASDALAFIRDAIHRDGPDADAIREALGLRWAHNWSFPKRRVVGEWQEAQP